MTAAAEQNAEEDQDPDPLIIVEKIAEASHIVILSLYRLDAVSLGFSVPGWTRASVRRVVSSRLCYQDMPPVRKGSGCSSKYGRKDFAGVKHDASFLCHPVGSRM